ncbi:MAG: hypothetical protein JXA77_16330 [Bacteroidales bacterium]|nr:hypothetical protein [Bacteroidales bacterium]MBN2818870.1 hypothetical protein [Bacteroidales bacterium]
MKGLFFQFLLIFLLIGTNLFGQEFIATSESGKFEIEKCSRILGGPVYSSYVFLEKQFSMYGLAFQHNYCIKPWDKAGIGIGYGITAYKKQTQVPFTIEFLKSYDKNWYFTLQSGYTLVWKRDPEYFESYTLRGGTNATAGIGYKIKLKSEIQTIIELSYNYQHGTLSHTAFVDEFLNIHSIVLSLGFLLEKK